MFKNCWECIRMRLLHVIGIIWEEIFCRNPQKLNFCKMYLPKNWYPPSVKKIYLETPDELLKKIKSIIFWNCTRNIFWISLYFGFTALSKRIFWWLWLYLKTNLAHATPKNFFFQRDFRTIRKASWNEKSEMDFDLKFDSFLKRVIFRHMWYIFMTTICYRILSTPIIISCRLLW